jgi:hypothetical protein
MSSALTAAFDTGRKEGHIITAPVGAGKTVYQGGMLVWDGAGNVQPLVGGTAAQPASFAGIARTGAVGGGDATAADNLAALGEVQINRHGVVYYNTDDATPKLGEVVYGITDNYVSSVAGATSIKVGVVVDIPGDGTVGVQIDNAVV